MVGLEGVLLLEHLLFLPSSFLLIPVGPLESKLQEDVKVEYNILQEHRCPPNAILLGQINIKLDQETVEHKDGTEEHFEVRFNFEFGIEVYLPEEDNFEQVSCEKKSNAPLN